MKDPVNDPVLTLNVIEVAAEAVVENDAEVAIDDVSAQEDVGGVNVRDVAAEEVIANDEEIALFAQLAVPKVDPL